jgi:transposase-like protein
MTKDEMKEQYLEKIRPIIGQAKRAYGAKSSKSPAHDASREYTRLLKEYRDGGGDLVELAGELGVAYSGIRRRVTMANTPAITNGRTKSKSTPEEVEAAVKRVAVAKCKGSRVYHAQLATEYFDNGVSLAAIAKGLGISNSFPLYYGVQRHVNREVGMS